MTARVSRRYAWLISKLKINEASHRKSTRDTGQSPCSSWEVRCEGRYGSLKEQVQYQSAGIREQKCISGENAAETARDKITPGRCH